MTDIERALQTALKAHGGQTDRSGRQSISHVLRVMSRVDDPTAKIVAVLHDVVEDSELSLDDLRSQGFSPEVVDAVDALTRRGGESYVDLLRRAKVNPLAHSVKLADLADHLDVKHVYFDDSDKEKHTHRIRRYVRAALYLRGDISDQDYVERASPDELEG